MPTSSIARKVFISHASVDKELAEALADLIRLGAGLSHEDILCSSLEGMGVPIGTTDYMEHLRSHLADAALVLPLFTPAFFDSEVCLIETGAMWGGQIPAFPLLVPPIDYARVEQLLGKVQGAKIDESSGLSNLRDRLAQDFPSTAGTAMWNAKREKFETRLPNLLENLAEGTRVSAEAMKVEKQQQLTLKKDVNELEAKVAELEEKNRALHEAKTAEEADAALAPKDEIERFKGAARTAADAVSSLDHQTCRALYESIGRESPYRPEWHEMDEADQAFRDDYLLYDEDEGYSPNYEDPTVKEARHALADLFSIDWSDELEEWFTKEYGKRFTIGSLPVWRALRLV